MIIERPNPSQMVLQVSAHNRDGSPKTALTSAAVRVYHMSGATEMVDLASTALVQVGSSNIWRYVWTPGALVVGQYFAEYALEDTDGADFVDVEGITVEDFALQTDLEFLVEAEKGKWQILNNQLIVWDTNGVEILRHNLFDINGDPTNGINMYKREPV